MKKENLLIMRNTALKKKDRIIEKILEAYKDAEGYGYNMHIDVLINENGDVYSTRPLIEGEKLKEQIDDKVKTIISCNSWEIDREYIFIFRTHFKNIENRERIIEEFNVQKEYGVKELFEFVDRFYPNVMRKMREEFKKDLFNNCFHKKAVYYLENFIKEIEVEILKLQ